jgi:hypothetical protein
MVLMLCKYCDFESVLHVVGQSVFGQARPEAHGDLLVRARSPCTAPRSIAVTCTNFNVDVLVPRIEFAGTRMPMPALTSLYTKLIA